MKVFVTGGTGLVGWGVLAALKEAGHEAVGLTHRPEGAAVLEKRGARAVMGDMHNPSTYASHVQDADAVIHMAEVFPLTRFSASRAKTLADADSACLNGLLSAVGPKTKAFVYSSGAWIYGDVPEPVTEERAPNPAPVVIFKAANDKAVLDAARAGKVPGMTARLGQVYGPMGKFMDTTLKAPLNKKKGMALGPGSQMVSLIHAKDVGRAYVKMIEAPRPGEAYNIGDDRPLTSLQLSQKLAELCGAPKPGVLPRFVAKLVLGMIAEPLTTSHAIISRKVKEHFKFDLLYPTTDTGLPAVIEEARRG